MINNIESTISHRVSEVIAAQIACRLQCLPDMKINNTSGENKNSTALAISWYSSHASFMVHECQCLQFMLEHALHNFIQLHMTHKKHF